MDGIRDAVKGKIDVLYAKGSNLTYDLALEQRVSHWGKRFHRDGRSPIEMTSEALLIAQKADIIIAVMGEGAEMSGEGASRTNLDIPDAQKDLLKELKKLNKPIVLVLCSGRPMTLVWENDNLDAILNIWFPGSEAGNAVADVLFGDAAPGGRLTMTYPRSVGQVPIRYNYRKTGRPPFDSGWIAPYVTGYIDDKHLPLYPFGFGLTYTQFEYSDIKLNRNDMTPNEKIKASVTVQNIGKASGHELVQLYLRDVKCSITRPVKELKGFEKIYLKPGEEKVVEFEIGVDMLRFYNNDLDHIYEAGKFEVLIGTNSETVNSVSFELKSN